MEIYFNELSAIKASSDTEAKKWISQLVGLCKFLRQILASLDNQLTLRTTDDFLLLQITNSHNFIEFLQNNYGFSDPELNIFLDILSNPNIEKTDPLIEKYEYSSISINGVTDNKPMSGLGASYIKNTMSISLDSNTKWDNCKVYFEIHLLNLENSTEIHSENVNTRHASKVQHIIDCHLDFLLITMNNWDLHKSKFSEVIASEENNFEDFWALFNCIYYQENIRTIIDLKVLYPNYTFENQAFEDLMYWKSLDTQIYERLHLLLKDIAINPFVGGSGQTEKLRHEPDKCSKRINQEHRVTYSLQGIPPQIRIYRCRGHYEDR